MSIKIIKIRILKIRMRTNNKKIHKNFNIKSFKFKCALTFHFESTTSILKAISMLSILFTIKKKVIIITNKKMTWKMKILSCLFTSRLTNLFYKDFISPRFIIIHSRKNFRSEPPR